MTASEPYEELLRIAEDFNTLEKMPAINLTDFCASYGASCIFAPHHSPHWGPLRLQRQNSLITPAMGPHQHSMAGQEELWEDQPFSLPIEQSHTIKQPGAHFLGVKDVSFINLEN